MHIVRPKYYERLYTMVKTVGALRCAIVHTHETRSEVFRSFIETINPRFSVFHISLLRIWIAQVFTKIICKDLFVHVCCETTREGHILVNYRIM